VYDIHKLPRKFLHILQKVYCTSLADVCFVQHIVLFAGFKCVSWTRQEQVINNYISIENQFGRLNNVNSHFVPASTVTELTDKLRTESTVPGGFTLIIKGSSPRRRMILIRALSLTKCSCYSLAEIDEASGTAELSLLAHESLDYITADVISDQLTYQTWPTTSDTTHTTSVEQ